MTKYKKTLIYKGSRGVLVIIAVGYMIVSLTCRYAIAYKIQSTEADIQQKEQDKVRIQNEIRLLQEDTAILEKEVDELTAVLWRYKPILIPDSMK